MKRLVAGAFAAIMLCLSPVDAGIGRTTTTTTTEGTPDVFVSPSTTEVLPFVSSYSGGSAGRASRRSYVSVNVGTDDDYSTRGGSAGNAGRSGGRDRIKVRVRVR